MAMKKRKKKREKKVQLHLKKSGGSLWNKCGRMIGLNMEIGIKGTIVLKVLREVSHYIQIYPTRPLAYIITK